MGKEEVYKLIDAHYRDNAKDQMTKLSRAAGSTHNAEDVVQEAYARACKYWTSYDGKKPFHTWFISILNNCLRDSQKQVILNGMVADDLAPFSEPEQLKADDVVLIAEVARAIEKQPEATRQPLRLYLLLGYTSKEVAEVTPYTPEAVRQTVSRFKRELFGTQAA